jgi:predicted nucleic acid-binding protein
MILLVMDSTPLIHLGKSNILEKVPELGYRVIIPMTVFEEVVVKGKRKGQIESLDIERIIRDGPFDVMDIKNGEIHTLFQDNSKLSDADKDVLEAAKKNEGIAIIDESYGRSICDVEGIRHRGSLWILKELIIHGAISPESGKDTLDDMIEGGWYCSTVLYSKALRMFGEYK